MGKKIVSIRKMDRKKVDRKKAGGRVISRKKVSRKKVSRKKVSRKKVSRRKYAKKHKDTFSSYKDKITKIIKKIYRMNRKYKGLQKGGGPPELDALLTQMSDTIKAIAESGVMGLEQAFGNLMLLYNYVLLYYSLFNQLFILINVFIKIILDRKWKPDNRLIDVLDHASTAIINEPAPPNVRVDGLTGVVEAYVVVLNELLYHVKRALHPHLRPHNRAEQAVATAAGGDPLLSPIGLLAELTDQHKAHIKHGLKKEYPELKGAVLPDGEIHVDDAINQPVRPQPVRQRIDLPPFFAGENFVPPRGSPFMLEIFAPKMNILRGRNAIWATRAGPAESWGNWLQTAIETPAAAAAGLPPGAYRDVGHPMFGTHRRVSDQHTFDAYICAQGVLVAASIPTQSATLRQIRKQAGPTDGDQLPLRPAGIIGGMQAGAAAGDNISNGAAQAIRNLYSGFEIWGTVEQPPLAGAVVGAPAIRVPPTSTFGAAWTSDDGLAAYDIIQNRLINYAIYITLCHYLIAMLVIIINQVKFMQAVFTDMNDPHDHRYKVRGAKSGEPPDVESFVNSGDVIQRWSDGVERVTADPTQSPWPDL